MIQVQLVDGPLAGQLLEVPRPVCRARLDVASEFWFAASAMGGARLLRGNFDRRTWLSYQRYTYEKIGKVIMGRARYRWRETVMVERCARYMARDRGRCSNEAQPGGEYCAVHA